jgi:UDP-glucose 4-epimerase
MDFYFCGIENWMMPYINKKEKKSIFYKNIPIDIYRDCNDKINFIFTTDYINTFYELGALLDRIQILFEINKINKILYISSYNVYGENKKIDNNPKNIVGTKNIIVEKFLSYVSFKYNVTVIILRAFNVYGPGQEEFYIIPSIINQIIKNEILSVGDVEKVRDFIFIEDFIDILFLLLNIDNDNICSIYDAGTGNGIKIKELVELIKNVTGISTKTIFDINKLRKEFDYDKAIAEMNNFKSKFNWSHKISLYKGLELTYQWLRGRSGV